MPEIKDWITQQYPISGPSIVDQLKKINGDSVFVVSQQAQYTPDISEYSSEETKKAICGTIDCYSRAWDKKLQRVQKQCTTLQEQRTARELEITQNQNDIAGNSNTRKDMMSQIDAFSSKSITLSTNIVTLRQQIEQERRQRKRCVKSLKKIRKVFLKVKPPSVEAKSEGIWSDIAKLLVPLISGKEPDFFLMAKLPKVKIAPSSTPSLPLTPTFNNAAPVTGTPATYTGTSSTGFGENDNVSSRSAQHLRPHAASVVGTPSFSLFTPIMASPSMQSSSVLRSASPSSCSSRSSSTSPNLPPAFGTTEKPATSASPHLNTNSSPSLGIEANTPRPPTTTTTTTTSTTTTTLRQSTNNNTFLSLKGAAEVPLVITHLAPNSAPKTPVLPEEVKSKQTQGRRWFRTRRSDKKD
ncbi:hypothetical protein Pelo_15961 [Pelomyxa schiedti]|nr:hypothetical protein Pelo_15961 [Pelomyxa schiedti]